MPEGGRKGLCKKRNVVYETFCKLCGNVIIEEEDIEAEKGGGNKGEKRKREERRKIKEFENKKEYKYKYIGETNKSGYERGKEHLGQKKKY